MELIKRIKHAEAQAQEIIEQAKAEITDLADKGRDSRRQAILEAEQQRKKAIEASVATARQRGRAEVESLKSQAEERRRQLRDRTSSRMATAAAKIMDYLRG